MLVAPTYRIGRSLLSSANNRFIPRNRERAARAKAREALRGMLSSALPWASGMLLLGSPPPRAALACDGRAPGIVGRLAAVPAPSLSLITSAPSLEEGRVAVAPSLPVPPLNVVMLLVGTLGDLLPFMAIARRMEQEHGHTVRPQLLGE